MIGSVEAIIYRSTAKGGSKSLINNKSHMGVDMYTLGKLAYMARQIALPHIINLSCKLT